MADAKTKAAPAADPAPAPATAPAADPAPATVKPKFTTTVTDAAPVPAAPASKLSAQTRAEQQAGRDAIGRFGDAE
jgi:hypothetical protein